MKKTKYSEGYIPKIQYWTDKLIKAGTPIEQAAALSKINYFKKKHQQKYVAAYRDWETDRKSTRLNSSH